MGRGHGSGRGVSAKAGGFQGDATMKGYSAGLAKAMNAKESEIVRNTEFETFVAFNDSGEVKFTKTGTKTRVNNMAEGDVRDRFVTHNHPSNASLSKSDIETAVIGNAKEMRARTPNYSYSMKRPEKGWPSERKAKGVYSDAERSITTWNQQYIRNYKGDKNVAHRRALAVKNHRINKAFAARLGIDYMKLRVN